MYCFTYLFILWSSRRRKNNRIKIGISKFTTSTQLQTACSNSCLVITFGRDVPYFLLTLTLRNTELIAERSIQSYFKLLFKNLETGEKNSNMTVILLQGGHDWNLARFPLHRLLLLLKVVVLVDDRRRQAKLTLLF